MHGLPRASAAGAGDLERSAVSGRVHDVTSGLGAEVRIDGLSTDAIAAGEGSLRDAGRGLLSQLGGGLGVQR